MKSLTIQDLTNAGLKALPFTGGYANKARTKSPTGIVFHTPGSTWAKGIWDKLPNKTPEQYDLAAGQAFDARNYQPNYLIGVTGLVMQLATDDLRTQHAGKLGTDSPAGDVYATDAWASWASPSSGGGWRQHGRDPKAVYDWWFAAFPGHKTPITVFPWKNMPNDALGIDLLPVVDGSGGPQQTQAQFDAAVKLVSMLAKLHGFAINKINVTTHSMCSPVERGTVVSGGKIIGTPWDLSPKQWRHDEMVAQAAARLNIA